jgi:hypothetical protein
VYLVWLGFVARRQRAPTSRKVFPQIVRAMLKLFPAGIRGRHAKRKA